MLLLLVALIFVVIFALLRSTVVASANSSWSSRVRHSGSPAASSRLPRRSHQVSSPDASTTAGDTVPPLGTPVVLRQQPDEHTMREHLHRPARHGRVVLAAGCRLVALGDIHGDLSNTKKALHLAKLADAAGTWTGGCSTLVQTGDVVDRGQDSVRALEYLQSLQGQAAEDGGRVVLLLGNHEIMNLQGQTAYVNPLELQKHGGVDGWLRLFSPRGGRLGARLMSHDVVAHINDTVFVHAGILPEFARHGASGLNDMAKRALRKSFYVSDGVDAGDGFGDVLGDNGPTWTRRLIFEARRRKCDVLRESLRILGARRMVVGHTVNEDGRVGVHCSGLLVVVALIELVPALGARPNPVGPEDLPDEDVGLSDLVIITS